MQTEPVLKWEIMYAEAPHSCHRMSVGLYIQAQPARHLPTGFQSRFDVLEAFTVLDKPALNSSQLCRFDLPDTNKNPAPKASIHSPGLAAPHSQNQARAGRDDQSLDNTTRWVPVGKAPTKCPKTEKENGDGSQTVSKLPFLLLTCHPVVTHICHKAGQRQSKIVFSISPSHFLGNACRNSNPHLLPSTSRCWHLATCVSAPSLPPGGCFMDWHTHSLISLN